MTKKMKKYNPIPKSLFEKRLFQRFEEHARRVELSKEKKKHKGKN